MKHVVMVAAVLVLGSMTAARAQYMGPVEADIYNSQLTALQRQQAVERDQAMRRQEDLDLRLEQQRQEMNRLNFEAQGGRYGNR